MPRSWSERRRAKFEAKQARKRGRIAAREEFESAIEELREERNLCEVESLAIATNQHILAIDDSPAGDIIAVGDEPVEVPSPRHVQVELPPEPPAKRSSSPRHEPVMETDERDVPWWHR